MPPVCARDGVGAEAELSLELKRASRLLNEPPTKILSLPSMMIDVIRPSKYEPSVVLKAVSGVASVLNRIR